MNKRDEPRPEKLILSFNTALFLVHGIRLRPSPDRWL
jgi:hypothetical protein